MSHESDHGFVSRDCSAPGGWVRAIFIVGKGSLYTSFFKRHLGKFWKKHKTKIVCFLAGAAVAVSLMEPK